MRNIKKRGSQLNLLLLLILITYIILFISLFMKWKSNRNNNELEQWKIAHEVADRSKPTPSPWPTPTHAPLPLLPQYNPAPRTQFNISTWKTYENKEVGLRFKYPQEWEISNNKLHKSCGGRDYYESCKDIGYEFDLSFSNFTLDIGGTAGTYTLGRETGPTEFGGFQGKEPVSFCDYRGTSWFCQTTPPRIHVLTFETAYGINTPYRLLYVDSPNNLIKGFGFSGSFLSKKFMDYIESLNTYFLVFARTEIPTSNLKPLRDAILQRRLDPESMKNFDLIEKVYETVEVF